MSKYRKKANYLDFIPVRNPAYTWEETKGIVTIDMVHNGFYDKIAQKFFKKPRVSHIKLEKYGSFVWKQIDGERSVGEIGTLLEEAFGEEAAPVYERLARYMQTLRNNKFIYYKKVDKKAGI